MEIFVEENRAFVGGLELAVFVHDGSAEGALTWPNSSLSSSVSGRVPQLTSMNGFPDRGTVAWMARAAWLAVPLSPVSAPSVSVPAMTPDGVEHAFHPEGRDRPCCPDGAHVQLLAQTAVFLDQMLLLKRRARWRASPRHR